MPDFESLYQLLSDALTNAVYFLQKGDTSKALSLMLCAQECAEEACMAPEEKNLQKI